MIPQKPTKDANLDAQLDKDIANAEKKSKEDIKKGKPKLAQAVATKYLKFIIIGVAALGLGYKMFFSGEKEEPVKKKTNTIKSKKKDEQKVMADTKIAKGKSGEINKDKEEIKKIISITDQTISNSEAISSVSVPKLTLPNVPSVPTIEKIAVKEDEQKKINEAVAKSKAISDKEIEKLQKEKEDLEKKLEEKQNKNSKNNKKNNKNKKGKKGKKGEDDDEDSENSKGEDSGSLNLPNKGSGLPGGGGGLKIPDSKGSSLPNGGKKANKPSSGNPSKDALNEMFILSGSGPKQKTKKSSSGDSKNDFIIFDGSSLSEQQVASNETANVQKLTNLENTISTGKVIDAVLETAISSEAAGMVRAIVSKDVYGETGRKILIPRGSRMFGSYTTTSSTTQTRLLLTWNKVIRPDGVVITMTGETYDQTGKKGIEGNIDTRYGELLKNSLLYSFITLGSAIALEKLAGIKSQSQYVSTNGTVTTTGISPSGMAAQSVITTVEDIVDKMTDGMTDDLDPVISIPQGLLLKVMSNTDIVVGQAYKRRYNNLELS